MSRHKNIKFVLISPDELKVPEYIKEEILEKNKITNNENRYISDNCSSFLFLIK